MFKMLSIAALVLAASAASAQSLPQMAHGRRRKFVRSRLTTIRLAAPNSLEFTPKVLFGDPAKAGLYMILLFVPAHTTIQAHSHGDDRMASVLSGEWHFGYGERFDAQSLKTLPPGSVYSEPGSVNHFARTDADPVIVQISGYGPTDTRYFDPANDSQIAGEEVILVSSICGIAIFTPATGPFPPIRKSREE